MDEKKIVLMFHDAETGVSNVREMTDEEHAAYLELNSNAAALFVVDQFAPVEE